MSKFIKGLDLCETFFHEAAKPIIKKHYPTLRFSAGLLGYGSDVLGYDDAVSTDHMWGPRFYLFLEEKDISLSSGLLSLFEKELPFEHRGFSVNFSAPAGKKNPMRCAEPITSGRVSPLLWISTIEGFIKEYLGILPKTPLEWLSVSEHRLLGFTSGKLFVDDLGLSGIRKSLSFYPKDVKLYLIASQWALLSEEQAFVKRCGDRSDEIGSRLICARMIERLLRLCFLYENTYAPYSKWFGTAFSELSIAFPVQKECEKALSAVSVKDREEHLVRAQLLLSEIHNASCLTEKMEIQVQNYHERDIRVIFPEKISEKVQEHILDPSLKNYPLIGSVSQIGNFVALSDPPEFRENIQRLYEDIGCKG